jgi:WD40 repeat protein
VLVLFSGPRATWFAVSRRGAGKEVKPNRFWERLVVAEDGRHIAAARGRMIEVFEPATATAVGSPMQLEDRPGAIAFHPDGRKLLIGMRNGIAEVRDMFTGARLGLPLRHHGAIARVAFTASGPVSTLSLAERRSGPAVLTRWDSETAEATELLRIPYRGPAFPQFSRTGRFLHFEPSRGAQIWNVETGVPLAPMWERQPRRRTQWSEDDGLVLTSGRGAARLWSTASAPAPRYTIENAAGMASRLLTMDGNHVLILNSDGVACLWTIDGALLREIPHTTPVQSVAVGPAGRVATLGGGTLRVWTSRGDEMAKIRARVDGDVHFDPTGATIFLQSARGPLRAWRYATGDRRTWALTTGALVPRRKGRHFATHETFAEELIIWDAITRRKVATCRHEGGAVVVVMSPDSRMLLSGGQDGRAVVWKASDGARLHELPHHGPIVAAAISETGHHAATLSADQFLRLWELGTGGEVARFRYEGGGRTLDFSPDGSTLILASKWWIHSFDVRGGLAPRASRGLEGAWTGQYRFLTPSGGRIRVLVEPGPAGFRVDEVDFDAVDSVPLEGSADALQKEWSGRTGLTYEGEEVAPAAIVKGWRPAAARRRSTVRRTVARIAEVSEPL